MIFIINLEAVIEWINGRDVSIGGWFRRFGVSSFLLLVYSVHIEIFVLLFILWTESKSGHIMCFRSGWLWYLLAKTGVELTARSEYWI